MPDHALVACWEVTAGIVPGQPMPEYTRRYVLTDADRQKGEEEFGRLYIQRVGEAMVWAMGLQDYSRLNWVRLEWLWL